MTRVTVKSDSTAAAITADQPLTRPEFLRLPKPGVLCPLTGMSRSAINELILPTPRNNFAPLVKSFCLRQRGARTGIRLVDYDSLRTYIRNHEEKPVTGEEDQ